MDSLTNNYWYLIYLKVTLLDSFLFGESLHWSNQPWLTLDRFCLAHITLKRSKSVMFLRVSWSESVTKRNSWWIWVGQLFESLSCLKLLLKTPCIQIHIYIYTLYINILYMCVFYCFLSSAKMNEQKSKFEPPPRRKRRDLDDYGLNELKELKIPRSPRPKSIEKCCTAPPATWFCSFLPQELSQNFLMFSVSASFFLSTFIIIIISLQKMSRCTVSKNLRSVKRQRFAQKVL